MDLQLYIVAQILVKLMDGGLPIAEEDQCGEEYVRAEEDQCGDPTLPALTNVLRAAGAGECWHKHVTFLAHLLEVNRILRLWAAPDAVARCGLYHSAYSMSYVNLAIFEPDVCRARVAAVVGDEAERLVHLFCVVPRQQLVHDDLLFHYDDGDLAADLARSEESVLDARRGVFDEDEPWQRKIQRLLPADGITVKHIRTGDDVALSRRVAVTFLMMTMADFSDQLFDWQDRHLRARRPDNMEHLKRIAEEMQKQVAVAGAIQPKEENDLEFGCATHDRSSRIFASGLTSHGGVADGWTVKDDTVLSPEDGSAA
ncbi:uncharacterized protein LOC123408110 [Hordeum vulgare subsp. vulgare]|uniref:uncharacterized protein LOC123408110 n=1 Tax=Hordeum vulgare subsp. vulgare TaxID=112509 RepID=UPI001D1A51E1|nr:uncharacterized protein LOC123408110 [Hordeum vulgare subsp. vulgare]